MDQFKMKRWEDNLSTFDCMDCMHVWWFSVYKVVASCWVLIEYIIGYTQYQVVVTYGVQMGCTQDWFRMTPWAANLSMFGVIIDGLLNPTSFHPTQ